MGKYFVDFKETAKMEIAKIKKSGDLATFKKLEKIIIELSDHPTSGIGNPEQLKHSLSGYWSRRINKKDRIVYEIIEEPEQLVVVVSALGHY
ncbi:MAG TPA: Txe/YoeB family addiction module toxin [Kaistella sp.]|jgi:toxin YoeB|nr:Txe/YoeB family addiction module toxin [Kaistella sp.]HPZ25243.1 Txe/YoeB family addiction module toxin [Kaistella sp.]HQD46100.1 Txe/YoeB family addiction module toxin [Kaistella sp.]